MKLTKKETFKLFGELKITECFEHEGSVYMKTEEMEDSVNDVIVNSVRFKDGTFIRFGDNEKVFYKPDAELVY